MTEKGSSDTSLAAFKRYLLSVRSEGTAEKYTAACRYFLKAMEGWGIGTLEEIPANVLTRYVVQLCQDGYQAQTVHWYTSAAKRYLRFARDQGVQIIDTLPPDLPRVNVKIRKTLPKEFLARYVELAGDLLLEPYATAVALMPFVGLRGAELVKLRLDSISRRSVTLRGGETRDSFVLQLIGKGGDERIVPVLPEGRIILTEYLMHWRKHQRGIWLFPKPPTGRVPVSDRTIRAALSRLCDPLGMDFSPHTLRRTYLLRLWRGGVDATVIARIAGHKNIQTTFKHYLALDDEDILKNVFGEQRGA